MFSKGQATEIIERLLYIRTLQAPNDKIPGELFEEALSKDDPVEWVKVIKTCYARNNFDADRKRPLPQKLSLLGENAVKRFNGEIAASLGIQPTEAEDYIKNYIDDNL